MKITEIRIYSEVLEQGLDFKEYIKNINSELTVTNVYTKKLRGEFEKGDSIIDRIRKVKDIDVLITAISDSMEYPLLLIEYSTAVPADDHKMQRSDVYYWSGAFKIPMMKISPVSKGMEQKFGGGTKFSDELEVAMACRRNAVLYHIPWENEKNKSVLTVKENALSCIKPSKKIDKILKELLSCFESVESFEKYFETLQKAFIASNNEVVKLYNEKKIKDILTQSTRFNWLGNKLRVKINRFGHAMDPDRGVLYFVNMLLGAENTISEIQVNRPCDYSCRGGYAKLFDALSRRKILEEYVKQIIKNGNEFKDKDAIYVFKTALNIDDSLIFTKISEHNYFINDDNLLKFLNTYPSITPKSIFFLSTELHLTDKDRNIICKIKWNKQPIETFINNISSAQFHVTNISPVTINDVKEDIITYASVELYKKLKFDLLAVSYPGAQGDRCVLTGSGREVIRTYADIIAFKNSSNGFNVYLEECKENFAKSKSDVLKLNEFKNNKLKESGLRQLFQKTIGIDNFDKLYTSVAAKATNSVPHFDVDYIFMFDIENSGSSTTKIHYIVALVDLNLSEDFAKLKDSKGKLRGVIEIDKLYRIK